MLRKLKERFNTLFINLMESDDSESSIKFKNARGGAIVVTLLLSTISASLMALSISFSTINFLAELGKTTTDILFNLSINLSCIIIPLASLYVVKEYIDYKSSQKNKKLQKNMDINEKTITFEQNFQPTVKETQNNILNEAKNTDADIMPFEYKAKIRPKLN